MLRAKPFEQTRKDHRTELVEDYTELVLDLIEAHGEARVCEVAKNLGVSHVTALRNIKRIQEEGYLQTSPHKPIVLTKKGRALALNSRKRHRLLVEFFTSIGIPPNVAEEDVEGAEHHISDTSLRYIKKFLARRA